MRTLLRRNVNCVTLVRKEEIAMPTRTSQRTKRAEQGLSLRLNTTLLRERIPNLTAAAAAAGLRAATVSNLCTGRTDPGRAEVRTLRVLADLAHCRIDDLLLMAASPEATGYADLVSRWAQAAGGTRRVHGARVEAPLPESDGMAFIQALPLAKVQAGRASPRRERRTF
jgi:hypothetical protein